MNSIQVIVPIENERAITRALNAIYDASSVAVFRGDSTALILFRSTSKKSDFILGLLEKLGVGVDFGVIDVLPLSATKPALKSASVRREYKVDDRLSLEEIFHKVDSENHLTFNYMCFTVVAGLIAAVGLGTNSPATVVASMLVSPLMGPIVAFTLGVTILDGRLVRKGLRNELVGVLLTVLVGIIWGCCTAWFPEMWGQTEQISRGLVTSLYSGIAVAIPSGAGVALATTSGGSSALVGVAISAALLPPVVNSGAHLAYGLILMLRPEVGPEVHSDEILMISLFSFLLFAINFVCIFLAAVLFFKIKRLGPGRVLHRTNNWRDIERDFDDENEEYDEVASLLSNLPTSDMELTEPI